MTADAQSVGSPAAGSPVRSGLGHVGARLQVLVVFLGVVNMLMLSGCSFGNRTTDNSASGSTEVRPPTIIVGNDDRPFSDFEDSKEIQDAFARIGVKTIGGAVVWFNVVPDSEKNPLAGLASRELSQAAAEGLVLSDAELSSVVREALTIAGVSSGTPVADIDIGAFSQGVPLLQAARNAVENALLRAGYTVMLMQTYNPWGPAALTVDGAVIGELKVDLESKWRRFAVRLAGITDDSRFVDVGIKLVDPDSGVSPVRFRESVELVRGEQVRLNVTPEVVPTLSIGMSPSLETGTAAVLAGDAVSLRVDSPVRGELRDVIWIELARASGTSYVPDPSTEVSLGSEALAGLSAWANLRSMIIDEKSRRSGGLVPRLYGDRGGELNPSLMGGGLYRDRVIGTGLEATWYPELESPDTRIVVLARNENGHWGTAVRRVPVMDLRPGIWMLPRGSMAFRGSLDVGLVPRDEFHWSRISQIDVVRGVLAQSEFHAVAGTPIEIDVNVTPYSEAHVPAESVSIDFGDGDSALVGIDYLPTRITHTYRNAGRYEVGIRSRGVDGLVRLMTTTVVVTEPDNASELEAKLAEDATATQDESNESVGVSAASLFREAARRWASKVASTIPGKHTDVEFAQLHSRLDRSVLDYLDQVLVEAFMLDGRKVFEREPGWSKVVPGRGAYDAAGEFDGQARPMAAPGMDSMVVAVKLYQAGVHTTPLEGGMAIRTATLRAYLRLHDQKTGEVLMATEVPVQVQELVSSGSSMLEDDRGWNDQPSNWMVYARDQEGTESEDGEGDN